MPINHTPDAIRHYLSSQANYALLISGKWGSGKTYYFKKVITPIIKSTQTRNNASRYYNIIELSVFGLSTIEEVETKIFVQLLPFLGEGATGLIAKSTGLFAKAILAYKTGEWKSIQAGSKVIDESIVDTTALFKKGAKSVVKQYVDFTDFVIFIDDIERGVDEKGISLVTLLGYINTLVDYGFKIIAIANEEEITDQKFKILKEKVIGETIGFAQTLDDVFEEVVNHEFSSFKSYIAFLLSQRALLISLFPYHNLRVFIRFVHKFKDIYFGITVTDEGMLPRIINIGNAMPFVLRFAVAIFAEFQSNKLSYVDRVQLGTVSMQLSQYMERSLGSTKQESKKDDTIGDFILKTYYKNNEKYIFIEQVFDYIVSGLVFDSNGLINELAKIFPFDTSAHLTPMQKIFAKLEYDQVLKLNDEEYNTLLEQVMRHVEGGDFLIGDYIQLYWRFMAFGNPLGYGRLNLVKQLVKGMKKSLPHSSFVPNSEMFFSLAAIKPDKDYKYLDVLRRITLRYNEKLKQSHTLSIQKKAALILAEDIEKFITYVMSRNNIQIPLFKRIDPKLFANKLMNSIDAFNAIPEQLKLRSAYNHSAYERQFWVAVINHMDHEIRKDGLQRHRFQRFSKALATYCHIPEAEAMAGDMGLSED